jgi:soluble lytic murein transglycosylase-like protein
MTHTQFTLFSLLSLAGLLLAASPVSSLPVDAYLALRRQAGYDPRLTYKQVAANPSFYVQRVLELRGRVNGSIRREGGLSFLLTMDKEHALLLDAPEADVPLVSEVNNQMLRVLVRVTESGSSNVVPLHVLALTYDAEVSLRERQAAMRQVQAEARRQSARPLNERAEALRASRGYRVRPISPLPTGPISTLARQYLTPEAQAIYPAYRQFIYRCNPRLTEQELDLITVSILHFSQRHRVDPRLVVAMIIAESDFNPRSTSHKGAMGLGQIMPDEARAHNLTNPYDPVQNVRATVNLLRMKLDLYREPGSSESNPTWNQIIKALAAYNAGAGAVRKYGGVPPYRETQGYIKRILRIYTKLLGY